MEPTLIIGSGLAILGSKDLLTKLLGPSADYIGGEFKNLVQKCNVNLDSIFQKAARKLGERINDGSSVNPRVLKHVVDEGRFCEDDLTSEYYGGILASSRSRIGRDDRGVTLLALIKDLSVYQLRFHFVIYLTVNRLFKGQSFNLGDGNDCHKMRFFIPMDVYRTAMGFTEGEDPNTILPHCLFGLDKHKLISDFASGQTEFLHKQHKSIPGEGILLAPTLPGAELFLWAVGLPGASGRELLQVGVSGAVSGVEIPEGSISLSTLEEKRKEAEANKTGERTGASPPGSSPEAKP